MDAYIYQGGKLFPDASQTHFLLGGQPRNWGRIPFIPFRYNEEEQPLVNLIKSLVDNYDLQASIYADMLADLPQFIYKLVNYGGQDLEMFLRELQEYRVVSLDENGDVDKLQADPNTAAVEGMLSQARRDIYEFGRGVDSQNEQLGNASGTALKFRYADLDMDCNILETEFQKSFEELLWFVKQYLFFTGKGNYLDEKVELILNRDILIAESEAIANCKESVGIIPDAVIAANHPWM